MRKAMLFLSAHLMLCLPALPQSSGPAPPPPSVAGYRTWVRVNPNPHRIDKRINMLCRIVPMERVALKSPHRDRWVTVYVNPVAKQAMVRQVPPTFPRGSVIVKEKVLQKGGPPELLTVMHKREAGYNPANGDWEYLVFNGADLRITGRGRLASCQSCHAQWRRSDYVSRVYLTDPSWGFTD